MTSRDDASTRPVTGGRLAAARAVAVLAALFWGVLFFGLIDLGVVVLQDERFFEHYLLEAGWGLLYTGLVMVPLLIWAVTPRAVVLLQLVLAVAVSVLLTGLAALALGQVLPALALGLCALAPAALAGRSLRLPVQAVQRVHPVLGGLVAVALVGGLVYAVAMIRAAHDGVPDDNTWGLMHLPMQAALGLALAGCSGVVATPRAAGVAGWRGGTGPADGHSDRAGSGLGLAPGPPRQLGHRGRGGVHRLGGRLRRLRAPAAASERSRGRVIRAEILTHDP